jgi:uncharacterized protein (DUF433 family)
MTPAAALSHLTPEDPAVIAEDYDLDIADVEAAVLYERAA